VIARTVALIVLTAGSAQAQSPGAAAEPFVGAWRLVSWTQRLADGTTRAAAADTGNIIYTANGRMCAILQNSKRQKWSGPPKTLEEATARMSGNTAYCARVEINAKEGYVLHHVDLDFNPSSIGIVRKRWFVFEGANRLRLKIDRGELPKTVEESELVWERVTGGAD
jgi:hypothetical protein